MPFSGHVGEEQRKASAGGEASVFERFVEDFLRPGGDFAKRFFHRENACGNSGFLAATGGGSPKNAAHEFGHEQSVAQAQRLEVGLHRGIGFLPLGQLGLAEWPQGF
ncbi:MAG: hypothetical protein EAZ84_03330 [Verrucomicrobia bacterium]|nr:MAG: hypothetical protein EAZ84_03330 [Verrucomicrobiota bacterium]TAE87255.1 MAG: hypothetical protein EAZ82_08420 [Verrucomicrobiota bacterium]TAF25090.1 MAG: hypothetical protein EAZ71_08645 [Verrucomicrobiota bacterium]